jgi:hypothetical protein
MEDVIIEFDDNGNAESDLARIWVDAPAGERERITKAEDDAERYLRQNPRGGTLITDGIHPPVRYLDWDVLRLFYRFHELENKILIIGFRRSA